MRRSLCLTALFTVLTSQVSAADFRRDLMIGGPPPAPSTTYKPKPDFDWGGLYGGVQAGLASADFKGGQSLAGSMFPNSEFRGLRDSVIAGIENRFSDQKPAFGGFVGHNWQDEDLVLGVELEYTNFGDLKGGSSKSYGLQEAVAPNEIRSLTLASSTSYRIRDAMIAKARFGQAYDALLPYGFLGIGAVRADYKNQASGTGIVYDPADPQTVIRGDTDAKSARRNAPILAVAAGAGVDYAFTSNIVGRVEYMFLAAQKTQGTSAYINSLRAGVAAKF